MPNSPALKDVTQKMNHIKNSLGNLKFDRTFKIDRNKIFTFFPILFTIFLILLRPSFILKDDYTNMDDENEIDFKKVILFFLIFQTPLFLSIFINS